MSSRETTRPSDQPHHGKVALVTGASRGIGRAIALRLAAAGADVVVHYRSDLAAARETAAGVARLGRSAFLVGQPLDAPDSAAHLFAAVDQQLRVERGSTRLSVLVNNAGISPPGTLDQITAAGFDELFAVNLRAPLFLAQSAARRMGEGGRIVNISSATVRRAMPEWLMYTMTKTALEAMTRLIAQELGPRGITMNALSVGVVDTEMNADVDRDVMLAHAEQTSALGRIGQPDDVADIVAFLVSDEARWVTGHVIDASGGAFL